MILDGRILSAEDAVDQALDLFRKRDSMKAELSSRVDLAQQQLKTVFYKLLNS
jgi:hypothetical protein